jgi:hypothetical protein
LERARRIDLVIRPNDTSALRVALALSRNNIAL